MLEWARTARSESIAGAYLIAPFKRYEKFSNCSNNRRSVIISAHRPYFEFVAATTP